MDNTFYQQLISEECELSDHLKSLQLNCDEIKETLDAVRVLKDRYEKMNLSKSKNPTPNISSVQRGKQKITIDFDAVKFDENQTQYQKTYVALHNIRSGFATDIAKELTRLSPKEFDEEKAKKVAREKASDLQQAKIFKIQKFGRKYKYSINEELE